MHIEAFIIKTKKAANKTLIKLCMKTLYEKVLLTIVIRQKFCECFLIFHLLINNFRFKVSIKLNSWKLRINSCNLP